MQKQSNNIVKILLEKKRVNNYTKLMILLNTLDYYEDYYIPNAKIMKMLKINKNRVIVLLKQLQEDKVIKIYYKKKKRYFVFLGFLKENDIKYLDKESNNNDMFDYDWLDEI